MALILTRRCNMTCGHCSVASGPQFKHEPSEKELLQRIRDAPAAGVRNVQLTGSEPMLRMDAVFRLLRKCRQGGLQAAVTTNGFWGSDAKEAYRFVRALQAAGPGLLTVSYDRYHTVHQDDEPAISIARGGGDSPLSHQRERGAPRQRRRVG
jgi:MoaA/NifB/PqqE/SkfB family radical SAM enzyme